MFRKKIVFYNKKLMYMYSKLHDFYDLMSSLIGLGLESLEYDFALIKLVDVLTVIIILYNYLMILLKNCEAELVTQFMYSLGLSLSSFSKLGYNNTCFTSVSEMFELRFLFTFEVLDFIV